MATNVQRLAAHKMALDAIPAGGGVAAGIAFLLDGGRVAQAAAEAERWARDAVAVVRAAADPNPWRDADDETIAAEILRQMDAKKEPRP